MLKKIRLQGEAECRIWISANYRILTIGWSAFCYIHNCNLQEELSLFRHNRNETISCTSQKISNSLFLLPFLLPDKKKASHFSPSSSLCCLLFLFLLLKAAVDEDAMAWTVDDVDGLEPTIEVVDLAILRTTEVVVLVE